MLSKSQISFITSLHQKKFRKQEGLFLAEGEKVVLDLLASSFGVKNIFATPSFLLNHPDEKKKHSSIEWNEVTEAELKKISALTTPHEVVAVAKIPLHQPDQNEIKNSLSLVLDGINDPGNLGTIIRIADWFGIKNVICSADTADCFNPKVVQAAMGSLFRVKIHYVDLEDFLEKNNQTIKLKVYGTGLKGESIYNAELSPAGLIVLGSESRGIRDEIKKYVNRSLHIPSYSADKNSASPDSLNVAAAAAIICAEFRRR